MMDMIKITKDMIPEVETAQFKVGDVVIVVKKNIPFTSKQLMAYQYAMYSTIEDNDNRVVYRIYKHEIIKSMLVLKYYTNVDTTEMTEQQSWYDAFDWLVFNGVYQNIMDYIADDMSFVLDIKSNIDYASKTIFENAHSLQNKLLNSFGSLLDVEDITQAIAKSDEVNNSMVSMIQALRQKNEQQKSVDSKNKMKIQNGHIVNISKKQ